MGSATQRRDHPFDTVRCFKKQNQSLPQRSKRQTRGVPLEMLRSCSALASLYTSGTF